MSATARSMAKNIGVQNKPNNHAITNENFETLYQENWRRVFGMCYKMTKNPILSQDLAQDTFVLAYRKLGSFRAKSKFSTWITRIAINVTRMHLRKRTLQQQAEMVTDSIGDKQFLHLPDPAQPRDHEARITNKITIIRLVSELPPGYRKAILLFYFKGYETEEAAERMNITPGACRLRLHKARKKLRAQLL